MSVPRPVSPCVALVTALLLMYSVQGLLNTDRIFTMYAYQKIFESCFGPQVASQWNRNVQDARAACAVSVMANFSSMVPGCSSSNTRSTTTTTTTTPPSNLFNTRGNEQQVVQYTNNRISQLDVALRKKNAMINCTLQRLGVIDMDMNLNTTALLRTYDSLNINSQLKDDVTGAVRECITMTSCLPMIDHSGLVPALKKALVYTACEKKRRALACIRNDLREKAALFELAGLEGVSMLTSSGVAQDQQTSKMFMLMWSDAYDSDDIFGTLGQ